MTDAARRQEWEQLRAERAALRGDLAASLAAIEGKARDPFGLKAMIGRHPIVAATVAAGVGALLVRLVLPHTRDGRDDRDEPVTAAPRDEVSPLWEAVRSALMRVLTPWIARFVAEHLGEFEALFGGDARSAASTSSQPATEPDGATPPEAADEVGTPAA